MSTSRYITFFMNTYSRTGKITKLIQLFSASQNSGGRNSINTVSLELCQWTYPRHLTPCHTNWWWQNSSPMQLTTKPSTTSLIDVSESDESINSQTGKKFQRGSHKAACLILNIFMNDFVYAVKQSRLSAPADDTHIFRWQYGGESGRGDKRGSRKWWSVVRAKRNEEEYL